MKGRESPSLINIYNRHVLSLIYHYCIVEEPSQKNFLSSPPNSNTFNLFSIHLHLDITRGGNSRNISLWYNLEEAPPVIRIYSVA